MKEKLLGVLGGVGPLATVYFVEDVINLTDAKTDQDHIPMIISNDVTIPDRSEYILDNTKPNPLPHMIENARRLERDGCDYIVIPCNTAHYFFHEIQRSISIPIINILEETVSYTQKTIPDIKCIGILATTGTVASGAYQNIIERHKLEWKVPSQEDQKSLMHIIYDEVKAGKKVDISEFLRIVEELKKMGSDAVILGCTELSVIKKDFHLDQVDIVDSMECLARKSIELCDKQLKQ